MGEVLLLRTNPADEDYRRLTLLLDADLKIRDGEDHAFFAQYNKSDSIREAIVAYVGLQPVGCGAFKFHEEGVAEIKRMYVKPEFRRKGIAKQILAELERWAIEKGFRTAILETGKKQPEAIAVYHGCGYTNIPNYGQYAGVTSSVCMQKDLL